MSENPDHSQVQHAILKDKEFLTLSDIFIFHTHKIFKTLA
jgi:hypothetical protein